jgi:hypothetical protein
MEELNALLQRCDKNALADVIRDMVQERYSGDEPDGGNACELDENVKRIVHRSLFKMKLDEQRKQDKDQKAFTVVLGAREVAGGKGGDDLKRTSTGLLVVGNDVLSIISTFLSWEKMQLQREWKASGDCVVSCHISLHSSIILASSGPDLHLLDAPSRRVKSTLKGHTNSIWKCCFFLMERQL